MGFARGEEAQPLLRAITNECFRTQRVPSGLVYLVLDCWVLVRSFLKNQPRTRSIRCRRIPGLGYPWVMVLCRVIHVSYSVRTSQPGKLKHVWFLDPPANAAYGKNSRDFTFYMPACFWCAISYSCCTGTHTPKKHSVLRCRWVDGKSNLSMTGFDFRHFLGT